MVLYSLPRIAAPALELVRVGEHARDRSGILGITDHLAIDAAAHLLARATRAGVAQYWSTLPHRLGEGQAEAFPQRILRDDRRRPLYRVDDKRVPRQIGHGQREDRDV